MYYCTGVEEEYQACAKRREEKEGVLSDARAELNALISEVEHSTKRLSELQREEKNAKTVTSSHPDTISHLREKIECALRILTTSVATTVTSTVSDSVVISDSAVSGGSESLLASGDPVPSDDVENMDSADH